MFCKEIFPTSGPGAGSTFNIIKKGKDPDKLHGGKK